MPLGEGTGSGSGSSGGTKFVYIDNKVYTTGPSHTVVTNRVKHGSTWYVYRTLYIHYSAPNSSAANPNGYSGNGSSGSSPSSSPSTPSGLTPAQLQAQADARRRAEAQARIRAEQQRLAAEARKRAAVLARSKRLESQQQRQLNKIAAERNARVRVTTTDARHAALLTNLDDRAKREKRMLRARRESERLLKQYGANQRSAEQGRTALRAFNALRRNPGSLSIHDLAVVVQDPASPFDPLDPLDVRGVQHWLRANGHKEVTVDGEWGEQTDAAIRASFRDAVAQERRRYINAVAGLMYDTGSLKAGEKAPGWWPLHDKIVPKPGELADLLQRGGFTAALLLRDLEREANRPDIRFLAWRSQEIRRLGNAILYGETSDPYAGILKPQREEVLAFRTFAQPELLNPQGQAMYRALYTSRDFDDFQRRLESLERVEEQHFQEMAAAQARDLPWWQDAIGFVSKPSEWVHVFHESEQEQGDLRAEFIRRVMDAQALRDRKLTDAEIDAIEREVYGDSLDSPRSGLHGLLGFSDADWEAGAHRVEELPLWHQIAFEMVFDPLNFVPGVGAIAKVGSKGAMALERAGVRIALSEATITRSLLGEGGSFSRIFLQSGLSLPSSSFRWLGATERRALGALRANESLAVRLSGAGAIYRGVEKATRLKSVAVSAARSNLELAARNGFRAVSSAVGKDIPETFWNRISTETRNLFDVKETELKAQMPTVMGDLIHALRSNRVSLYVDGARKEFSTVGARLLARMNAEFRVRELQQLATESATSMKKKLIEEGATREDAARAALEEYRRVVRAGGFFGHGGGDPAIEKQLSERIKNFSDSLELSIFPVLQGILEEAAEQSGEALFEALDDGRLLWAGRHGAADEILRRLNLHAFDPENLVKVPNPRFNVPVPYHVAEELVAAEVRIGRYQVISNHARREAAGDLVDDSVKARRLHEIEEVAWGHWKQTPDGWVDTREFVEVPSYYARHVEEAYLDTLSSDAIRGMSPNGERDILNFTLDKPRVEKLKKALGLSADTRIKLVVVTDAVYHQRGILGIYYSEFKEARVFIPSSALTGDASRATREINLASESVAHELRHAQQDRFGFSGFDNWFQDDVYHAQIGEVDARNFEGQAPKNFIRVEKGKAGTDFPEEVAPLAVIAVPPGNSKLLPVDDEIGKVARALGAGAGLGPDDEMLDRLLSAHAPRTRAQKEEMGKFREAVSGYNKALGAAWDEAQPYALRREWALWQAMAEAQSRPMKVLYQTLHGGLSVWIFATLPLRPGWVVRNVIDNFAKVLVSGARDPRLYFLGAAHPGAGIRSIFEGDIRAARHAAEFFDARFGTHVADAFDGMVESIFDHSSDVINKIFRAHAMPEVPEKILEQARFNPMRRERVPRPFEAAREAEEVSRISRWKDGIWEFMANRPENYAKRVKFRSEFLKAQKEGLNEVEAYWRAWDSVEATLFDYSKVSVIEDNLRVFFPFIQFWRKNTGFWVRNFAEKPWLPVNIIKAEEMLRDEIHGDLPEWMRRYVHVPLDKVGDVLLWLDPENRTGLGWLGNYLVDNDFIIDPINFFSFAPLYRAWKGDGLFDQIDPEKRGMAFIGPFVDAMNDWGLTLSPFVRKPLEGAGVLTSREWQTVFPQTPLAVAFTRDHLGDRWANRILDLDALVGLDFSFDSGRDAQEQFDNWVNLEMLGQAQRGEAVSRDRAVETIQDYFLIQTALGYFGGAYVRRMNPSDFYLYKLQDDLMTGEREWDDLSAEDKALRSYWRLRKGADSVDFQNWIDTMPLVEAYYRQTSYDAKERFKRENPAILPYVEPAFRGRPFSARYVQTAALVSETEAAFKLFDLIDKGDLDAETTRLARSLLITPELQEFWDANDTPAERQAKMLKGQYHGYLGHLQDTFFALPGDDWDAKEGFLNDHPELQRWWLLNNSRVDDYTGILNHVHADLRDRYFEYAEAGDWDGANAFLSAFPFIFDKIEDDRYIKDRETGRPGAGGMSQHAQDYQKAKRWLDYYFTLPEAQRSAWLNGDSEGARIVHWYFEKYAHDGSVGGMTAHARDYLASKSWLDYYFSLPQASRSAWLNGGSEGAGIVLAYFKKYGRTNRIGRSFTANSALLDSRNAELAKRLRFWTIYFNLPASERPAFVLAHAEEYGIFVYGIFGAKELHDREMRWMREALAAGIGERAAHYLFVKPLLDFFFTLNREQKKLFLRANPELEQYLEDWAQGTATGDDHLDKLLDAYFKLPDNSPQRSHFLHEHPELQDYFDSISSPRERAMHNLLEVYFSLPLAERKNFLLEHPEIQAYFDFKRRQDDFRDLQYGAFDAADPRFAPFREAGQDSIGATAERMLNYIRGQRAGNRAGDELTVRRTS